MYFDLLNKTQLESLKSESEVSAIADIWVSTVENYTIIVTQKDANAAMPISIKGKV